MSNCILQQDDPFMDYKLYDVGDISLRGPFDLKQNIVSVIGGENTFGRYCELPFSSLIANEFNINVVNFGGNHNMNPAYIDRVIDEINKTKVCVIELITARCQSNSEFINSDGWNGFNETLKLNQTVDDFWEYCISNYTDDKIKALIDETLSNYIKKYKKIFKKIKVPIILLYMSKSEPCDPDQYDTLWNVYGKFPHFINQNTITELTSCVDFFIECISSEGFPQELNHPVYGKIINDQYITPDIHKNIQKLLYEPINEILTNPEKYDNNKTYSYDIEQEIFKKIFFLNLDDRKDRFDDFKNIKNIERIDAFDTRYDKFKYKEYNFNLAPICNIYLFYFMRSPGAMGCFLSHYFIWKRIIEDELDYALVLEDDVDVLDVIDVLENPYKLDLNVNYFDLIQLNNRTQVGFAPGKFEGTESYIISQTGCKKLIALVENCKPIIDSFIFPVHEENHTFLISDKDVIKNMVLMPVDQFFGHASSNIMPDDIKINISVQNLIGLNKFIDDLSDITSIIEQDVWLSSKYEIKEELCSSMIHNWCREEKEYTHIKNKFIGIVSMPRMATTTLCNKIKQLDNMVVLDEAYALKPIGEFRKEAIKRNGIVDSLVIQSVITNELNIEPDKTIVFKLLCDQLDEQELIHLFRSGLDISLIFVNRNISDTYVSLTNAYITNNWGTTPSIQAGIADSRPNKQIKYPWLTPITNYENYIKKYTDWYSSIFNMCGKYNIQYTCTTFDDIISDNIDVKNVISNFDDRGVFYDLCPGIHSTENNKYIRFNFLDDISEHTADIMDVTHLLKLMIYIASYYELTLVLPDINIDWTKYYDIDNIICHGIRVMAKNSNVCNNVINIDIDDFDKFLKYCDEWNFIHIATRHVRIFYKKNLYDIVKSLCSNELNDVNMALDVNITNTQKYHYDIPCYDETFLKDCDNIVKILNEFNALDNIYILSTDNINIDDFKKHKCKYNFTYYSDIPKLKSIRDNDIHEFVLLEQIIYENYITSITSMDILDILYMNITDADKK